MHPSRPTYSKWGTRVPSFVSRASCRGLVYTRCAPFANALKDPPTATKLQRCLPLSQKSIFFLSSLSLSFSLSISSIDCHRTSYIYFYIFRKDCSLLPVTRATLERLNGYLFGNLLKGDWRVGSNFVGVDEEDFEIRTCDKG